MSLCSPAAVRAALGTGQPSPLLSALRRSPGRPFIHDIVSLKQSEAMDDLFRLQGTKGVWPWKKLFLFLTLSFRMKLAIVTLNSRLIEISIISTFYILPCPSFPQAKRACLSADRSGIIIRIDSGQAGMTFSVH